MSGDRSYKWGWHPDRPYDAVRPSRPGSDVVDPAATEGWVSTADFAALVGLGEVPVDPASVAACCRAGTLRARRVGRRWQVDAEEAEGLAIRLAEMARRAGERGQSVTGASLKPMPGRSPAPEALERAGGWRTAISMGTSGGSGVITLTYKGRKISYRSDTPRPTDEQMDRILHLRDALQAARRPLGR